MIWLDDKPHKPQQRAAFEQYMEHGGGWLGFHIAAYNDSDTRWPWFVRFLGGGVFYGNNWPPLMRVDAIKCQCAMRYVAPAFGLM